MSPKHMVLVKKLTMLERRRRKNCDYFLLFSISKDAPGVLFSF